MAISDNDAFVTAWKTTGAPANRQILHRVWSVSETGSDTTGLMISVPDNQSLISASSELPGEIGNKVFFLVDADGDFST